MDALLLIDLQNDFMPGGSLGVPGANEVIPIAIRLCGKFPFVLATQDWHPPDHGSFAENHVGRCPGERIELAGLPQILWPVHCVQNTPGAALHHDIDPGGITEIVRKGTDAEVDSYSGFFDNARRRATGLESSLRSRGISRLFVIGVATDYCVKFTVLDALSLGFETSVIIDGCRGVDLNPGDGARAEDEMRAAGAKIIRSDAW